ncbi:MAG TPA: hypothetical protein DCR26_01595 [Porphyromonadaceae bacterium]|nr:hypothetical protein [Porphyromonadaceae bacterium]
MNEHNYLIQFDYAGETHSIHNLSHCDFTKGLFSDKAVMAEIIELYIETANIHKDGAKVTNARLFGKGGELITRITDFSVEFRS